MTNAKNYDVIIIGGSYAGLSAAMSLARSLRRVMIIDSGLPCNRYSPHSHNFITQDGMEPGEITKKAREQVMSYPTISFLEDLATKGNQIKSGFRITTRSGKTFEATRLIFATGIKDHLPDIKGFDACWGVSIVHCPYCHGYELRNKKTAIMANGERGFHLASLVKNLTNDITILTSGKADYTADQLAKLKANKITIRDNQITEFKHTNGQVEKVVFSDGSEEVFDGIYAAVPFTQHSDLPESLGCELTDGGYIQVDGLQQTTRKGIYACGDNSSPLRAIANSVSAGNFTGAVVNRDLSEQEF